MWMDMTRQRLYLVFWIWYCNNHHQWWFESHVYTPTCIESHNRLCDQNMFHNILHSLYNSMGHDTHTALKPSHSTPMDTCLSYPDPRHSGKHSPERVPSYLQHTYNRLSNSDHDLRHKVGLDTHDTLEDPPRCNRPTRQSTLEKMVEICIHALENKPSTYRIQWGQRNLSFVHVLETVPSRSTTIPYPNNVMNH